MFIFADATFNGPVLTFFHGLTTMTLTQVGMCNRLLCLVEKG